MCRQTDRQTDTPQPSRYSLLLLLTLFSHFLLLLPPLSFFLYYNCFLNCDGSPVIKCSKCLDSGGSIDLIWNSSLLEQQQRLPPPPPPPPIFLLLSSRGPRPFESFYWLCLGLRWRWLAFFSFGIFVFLGFSCLGGIMCGCICYAWSSCYGCCDPFFFLSFLFSILKNLRRRFNLSSSYFILGL